MTARGWELPILMYHHVSRQSHPRFRKYTVSPRALDRQLRTLRLAGFRSVELESLAAPQPSALPRRPVAITFDDGFREAVHEAVPLLERHGFTATFFVPTGFVGASSSWLRREIDAEFPVLDWDDARALEAAGFRCGAHSVTHPPLAELGLEQVAEELAGSRRALEERLGRRVTELAYPFGSYDDAVRDAAAGAGYRIAVTTTERRARAADDPLALPRVPVVGTESGLDFLARVLSARPLRPLRPLLREVVGARRARGRG